VCRLEGSCASTPAEPAGNVCRLPHSVPLGEPSLALTFEAFAAGSDVSLHVVVKLLGEYSLRCHPPLGRAIRSRFARRPSIRLTTRSPWHRQLDAMSRESAIFSTLALKVAGSGERCASSAAAGYID
jgi:hypothetical protein